MKIEKPIILILFGLFALLSIIMIFAGFRAYSEIRFQTEENEKARTALCYVTNKIRASDNADKVYFQYVDGINTLVIEEKYDESIYKTYIYFYDGFLRECFLREDNQLKKNFGEKIIAIQGFEMNKEKNGLITIKTIDYENNKHSMSITLRSGGKDNEQIQNS